MEMNKKWISIIMCAVFLLTVTPSAGFAYVNNDSTDSIKLLAETFIEGDVVNFASFKYNNMTVRLFPEALISKDEAIKKYINAYEYITKIVAEFNIKADIDDKEFQEAVKSFFLIELDDKALEKEIKEFAAFMDFYENKHNNDTIINAISQKSVNEKEINNLMPASTLSTQAYDGTISSKSVAIPSELSEHTQNITTSSYNSSTAANYATTWWNKTNNTDFPYYADYYGQSTTNNNLNDLPAGASGQSNPRRGWNDCTNFVSQAIYKGGISTIKSGLILPHTSNDNWYYSDSKPSYTWGGADNFYKHFSNRAGIASISSDLQVGDVVSIDFTGDGSIDHTIIITKTTGTATSQQFVTYHTTDSNQTRNLKYFYDYNENVKLYGYEMDKVS